MLTGFLQLDREIFHAINSGLTTPPLDPVMRLISNPWLWWLVFLACLFVLLARKKYSWLRLWIACLLAVGLSDATASYVLKPWVARPRPCHSLPDVRLETACVSPYGFPSNHAANGMALLAVSLPELALVWRVAETIAVLAVGFSRVYLGVHFPGDVLAGFLLGALIGLAVRWLARKRQLSLT